LRTVPTRPAQQLAEQRPALHNGRVIEYQSEPERAYVIALRQGDITEHSAIAFLNELVALTETLGITVVGREVVQAREITPRYYLGSGKAEEIADRIAASEADIVVFDIELSPSQQRNWESLVDRAVTDRHGIILEIFAARALTREAQLQVELARLEYLLPRLTSAWSHLSRQRGGRRGTRGEGETQLEVDRRLVQQRIAAMRRELKNVRSQRATMRRQRSTESIPAGSIVGYTNAGKSSLLFRLTGREVMVADQLFSTLDPATRRLELEGGQEVLLTDTVGFIRRLPHGLVDAFKSTLEETVLADFLVHVIDASDPAAIDHARITRDVLAEIGSRDKPTIAVLNKTDVASDEARALVGAEFPDAVQVSAITGDGLDQLRAAIQTTITDQYSRITVRIPHDRYDLAALIHRTGRVIQEEYEENLIRIEADVPERTRRIVGENN
jgi:GTPase